MTDLDLRKIRYFLAVAEHLNFGRAAGALHIAQPVLSRQIRVLEDELRAQLFVRDQRGTELTPAGHQLLADAPGLVEQAAAATRRVSRAARGHGSFVVGFMPGLIVTGPVRALRAAHPDLAVEVLRTNWDDQVTGILDGRVDIGYIRLPVDQRGRPRRGPELERAAGLLRQQAVRRRAVRGGRPPLAGRAQQRPRARLGRHQDGRCGGPDDPGLAPVTQAWLAVSDDPRATVTGGYFYHQRPREVHPAARHERFGRQFLDYCAALTGIGLPASVPARS